VVHPNKKTSLLYAAALILAAAAPCALAAEAESVPTTISPTTRRTFTPQTCWETTAGMSVTVDNDLFAGGPHDADYTGGMALDWTPSHQNPYAGPQRLHYALDRLIGVADQGACRRHVWQLGLFALTPATLRSTVPVFDDRPFASLLAVGSTALWKGATEDVAWQSTLQVGALGLDVARAVHAMLHRLVDDEDPQGYQYQISSGGEPTARYVLARHQLLNDRLVRGETMQLKSATALSVGYLTEASMGFAVRWGRISSPWQSFTPEVTDYLPTPNPLALGGRGHSEFYAFAGARVKLRLYNVLMQGQFRDSVHVLPSSEVERLLAEGWVGLHWRPVDAWEFRYTMHVETPEIRSRSARRTIIWGGVSVSRRF